VGWSPIFLSKTGYIGSTYMICICIDFLILYFDFLY